MPDSKTYEWFGGSVPDGWSIVRLGSVFRERNESTTAEDLAPLSVTKKGVVEQQDSVAVSVIGAPKKVARKGDFVINSRSDRKGSAGIAPRDGSVSLINIVLEPKGIHPQFAKHLLTSVGFQEEFYRFGSGIVADLWTTRYSAMKAIQIPLPPFAEQERIADELDRELAEIDELIVHQENLLNLAKEKLDSRLVNIAFNQGVKRYPLKRFGEITLGKMITPSDKGGMQFTEYLRAANIQPYGELRLNDIKKMWFTKNEVLKLDLRKDDVLVVEGGVGGYGRSACLREDLPDTGFQNSINRFRAFPGIADPNYINFVLIGLRIGGYIEIISNQTSMPHLTAEKLALVEIPYISFESQKEISSLLIEELNKFREVKENIADSIKILKELKNKKISSKPY